MPLFSRTFRGAGRTPGKHDVRDAVADAVRTLALSELDYLAIPGDRLLYKKRAEPVLAAVLGN